MSSRHPSTTCPRPADRCSPTPSLSCNSSESTSSGFATTLGTAAQGLANAIGSSTLPASLQTALGQVAAGNIAGAASTLNNALTTAGLGVVLPLLPVFAIPSQMAQNLLNVTNLLSTGPLLPVALGLSVLNAVQDTPYFRLELAPKRLSTRSRRGTE